MPRASPGRYLRQRYLRRASHGEPARQSSQHRRSLQLERSQESLIRHVNNLVYESSTTNRYATFFYAEYDPFTHLSPIVNAGHNPPYILRGDQAIPLETTGTVVGLLPDAEYAQATIPMHPGDVLLAFTDGISEAMNHDDDEWGEERMIACAQKLLAEPGWPLRHSNSSTAFSKPPINSPPAHPDDDMTLLICTVGNPFSFKTRKLFDPCPTRDIFENRVIISSDEEFRPPGGQRRVPIFATPSSSLRWVHFRGS